jgi:predicted acylesterase/phospholipase RssA
MMRSFFLHLYMLRVPAGIMLLLGIILPYWFNSSLFHGLADLEANQIFPVSLAAFLLLSAAITCSFLVLLHGRERVDSSTSPAPQRCCRIGPHNALSGWIVGALYLAGGFLFLRFLFVVFETMKSAHLDPQGIGGIFWPQVLLGVLAGSAIVLIVFVLDLWLASPREQPEVDVFALPIVYLFRQSGWVRSAARKVSYSEPRTKRYLTPLINLWRRIAIFIARILGPGYGQVDKEGHVIDLSPGHEFAAIFVVFCLALYAVAGAGEHGRLATDDIFGAPRPWDAVLLQVILVLLIACWTLAGLSFYFDRFRVPVLFILGLFLVATSHIGSSDHAFHTFDRISNTRALPTAASRLAGAPDHVIGVAAAGGGIQSAAWTSQVMCGLRREIGPAFAQHVLVISGVSGGSVGTYFYLRCLDADQNDTSVEKAATNSSLEAIAWGLVHPDLLHAMFPIRSFWWPGDDRGWALERALRKNAQFQPADRPLAAANSSERWPTVLFNSTEVRTGDPIVFTNSDFPRATSADAQNHRLLGFHQIYGGRDVLVESAVRMSAAFPYVSPAARPDTPWNAEHMVDGGYFDNSGLFSLGEWLKEATNNAAPSLQSQLPPKKILIIQIDAFPYDVRKHPDDRPQSWGYQLTAPVSTVLRVRSEAQVVRDTTEGGDLLKVLAARGQDARVIVARYSPAKDICASNPPLTWHLTEVEKYCIQQSWNEIKTGLAAQVREFLNSPVTSPADVAKQGSVHTERLQPGLYLRGIEKR